MKERILTQAQSMLYANVIFSPIDCFMFNLTISIFCRFSAHKAKKKKTTGKKKTATKATGKRKANESEDEWVDSDDE